MSREIHVRFWERVRGKIPRATRLPPVLFTIGLGAWRPQSHVTVHILQQGAAAADCRTVSRTAFALFWGEALEQRVVKLPNADRAVVQPEKVRDYLLSPSHPVGRFKAAVFGSIGFSGEQWQDLQRWLLELARSGDAIAGQGSAYGQKFEIRANLVGPNGRTLAVVSVWIVLVGEDFPRFVTAFPG